MSTATKTPERGATARLEADERAGTSVAKAPSGRAVPGLGKTDPGKTDPGRTDPAETDPAPRTPGPAGRLKGRMRVPRPQSFGDFLKISFGLFVILPTFMSVLYLAFVASPLYEAESRFTVRSATESSAASRVFGEALSTLAGGNRGGSQSAQDVFIALNYIRSRNIIADLGGVPMLVRAFDPATADYFSRLDVNGPSEKVWDYWKSRIRTEYNTTSGIATLRVQSSDPAAALWLSEEILRATEGMINRISEEARRDALLRAEAELQLHRDRLTAAMLAVNAFRDRMKIIDPVIEAKSVGTVVAELMLQKVSAETQLATSSRDLAEDAPSRRMLEGQIAELDKQIDELRGQIAGEQGGNVLSEQIRTYEALQIESVFASQLYTAAQAAYSEAKARSDRKSLYVIRVIEPEQPERASYPDIPSGAFLVFATAGVLWSIAALMVAAVRDHSN